MLINSRLWALARQSDLLVNLGVGVIYSGCRFFNSGFGGMLGEPLQIRLATGQGRVKSLAQSLFLVSIYYK